MGLVEQYFGVVSAQFARADGLCHVKLAPGANPNRVLDFCRVALGVECRNYPDRTIRLSIPLNALNGDDRVALVVSDIIKRTATPPVLGGEADLVPVV